LAKAGLPQADRPLVIEGVRYATTLDGLRQVSAPAPVYLLHLDVSDAERNRRLAAEGVSAKEGAEWEQHGTEREVLSVLPGLADLVIDADQPVAEVRDCAISWIEERENG
jgi:hypothetical protein